VVSSVTWAKELLAHDLTPRLAWRSSRSYVPTRAYHSRSTSQKRKSSMKSSSAAGANAGVRNLHYNGDRL
jgi:hypothetical protein